MSYTRDKGIHWIKKSWRSLKILSEDQWRDRCESINAMFWGTNRRSENSKYLPFVGWEEEEKDGAIVWEEWEGQRC